jgi:hypothetical protein
MDNNLLKLAIDLGRGSVANYSNEEANDALRKAFMEIAGTDKIDYKTMRRFKPELFEVMEVILDRIIVEGITDQFNDFVEIRNLGWGDTNIFTVEDQSLFNVANVVDGNGDVRRQRLDNGSFTVTPVTKTVSIYEELYRYLAGRINWASLVQKVGASYQSQLNTDIYTALYDYYSSLTDTYAETGTYSETALLEMIGHVEAGTNSSVVILGTKNALSKVTSANVSENMKDQKNALGFYGMLAGTPMRMIKQAHKPGGDTFAINDSFLIVTPTPADKMVKLVFEGDSIIIENTDPGKRNDMQMEYTFIKKAGIAVVPSSKFGLYRLS